MRVPALHLLKYVFWPAGVVTKMKMQRTIVIRRDYLHYIRKYNRFEKRHKNISVHLSPCFRYVLFNVCQSSALWYPSSSFVVLHSSYLSAHDVFSHDGLPSSSSSDDIAFGTNWCSFIINGGKESLNVICLYKGTKNHNLQLTKFLFVAEMSWLETLSPLESADLSARPSDSTCWRWQRLPAPRSSSRNFKCSLHLRFGKMSNKTSCLICLFALLLVCRMCL